MSALSIEGRVVVEGAEFHYDLTIAQGEHLVILGPNGSGKSTLLRTLAGLARLQSGLVTEGDHVVDEPSTGIFVPAHERGVVLQPQSGALFPHLNAIDNVAFGHRSGAMSRSQARTAAAHTLDRLGIDHLTERSPADLSGGETAKVALARSLATDPAVLMLDEPGAALDAAAHAELRHHLTQMERTLVIVTHDPVDAQILADRVAVIEGHRVLQTGTPAELAAAPASPWVASVLGVNVVSGTAAGDIVTLESGASIRIADDAQGQVHLSFPANAVTLHSEQPHGSARNVWLVEITGLSSDDHRVRVSFEGPLEAMALVTSEAAVELGLRPGMSCWASLKATELSVLPA